MTFIKLHNVMFLHMGAKAILLESLSWFDQFLAK